MKTVDELRSSDYHQELGQKMWAAFLAQQQGISLNSAVKKVEGPSWRRMVDGCRFYATGIPRQHGTDSFTAYGQTIQHWPM
jgi:hypothetical protein